MRQFLIILLIVTYCMPIEPNALSYIFVHGNIFHLAANCVSIWCIFHPNRADNWETLAKALLMSLMAYPFSWAPAIGFSNVLFAAIGLRTPDWDNKWWTSWPVLTFFATTIIMAILPQVAATSHIAAFAFGALDAEFRRRR